MALEVFIKKKKTLLSNRCSKNDGIKHKILDTCFKSCTVDLIGRQIDRLTYY